ncbi:pyridoxamine 5'-phosphate oxidase family protein [Nocardioides mesophilus]|uniref:Pyridoxamine 5'-phosphate oxidase family protein n=1 Tax=Nocardioides mesophilus TaxID=433659 RepID=A0A7G9R7Q3_9ACTN|nr:pyridoxamine 5'-phosphate oxidase family protein [Nocardioides mesophilus]QNN51628.1 pyridoxamine 5'-phosphate oxidase family protein [Nocardioides mesophilus]
MSVPVDLDELGQQLEAFGFAYLLTVGDGLRAHAVAVRPALADGQLVVEGLGRRTLANLQARPDVSLVWPPVEEGGYSLILDGRAASFHEESRGVRVAPEHAVLHRPAG